MSQTRDPEWVAVRVMVPRAETNHVMDRAVRAGRAGHPGQRDPRRRGSEMAGLATMSVVTRVIPCLDVAAGRVVKGVNFLEPA